MDEPRNGIAGSAGRGVNTERPDRPSKPPGSSWTDEQWEAIRLRGSDILVSAAAGSGKTAVLVERIIRRITDERDPVDVDRLLVATFTNAAAGEMRQRIREAIEKKLETEPGSAHLRRQMALIHRAPITTLHSFCLEVIRRHCQRIQLDPSFRIANETEAELMRQDLLSELLEERFGLSGEDSPFWQLADSFGGERGDDALVRLILHVYDFSRSHPWPDVWLREAAGRFARAASGTAKVSDLLQALTADVKMELQGIAAVLTDALRSAERPGGPAPYAANLRDDLEQVERAIEASGKSWDGLYRAMNGIVFGKLNACRGKDVDKGLQEQVKQLRDMAKKQLNAIREELFVRTPEQYAGEMAEMAPIVLELAELVIEFAERYRRLKADKGLVDFADLEHYCLQILRHPDSTPEQLIPSDAAKEYREQFVEILLDEYQDTNAVQEAIVALITRPAPGNRFMVGDVKQSIYRFRLADPGLFTEKYKTYERSDQDEPAGGRKIGLKRNFRSRSHVVEAVNFLFRQIMTERVGEMDYDEDAELVYGASYPESPNDPSVELMIIDRGGSSEDESGSVESDADGGADSEGIDAEVFDTAGERAGPNPEEEEEQAETAQLEARYIAAQIRKLIGLTGGAPFQVYDRKTDSLRPLQFRDIVVLLRATSHWAPVFMEELRLAGIPVYAELNAGYFTATEVEIVLSLLKVIDNPYQDIPLAAVLRSPIVGLSAADLAQVRIRGKRKPYFEAVLSCAESDDGEGMNDPLAGKLRAFVAKLRGWQDEARQGSLSDLIWNIYSATGYYDYVGGMPDGLQRQANLRALYDRARQFEATSFRGLFRFLRFVERMQDSGQDLGAARALGEQEDVVRIMSIHKSKGLEFPVVFVAGLGKTFNQTDLNGTFLLHKELGFGPMRVEPRIRAAWPTLPLLAIKRRMRAEMTAEELRVLYVALTRPKEKLFLVGSVKSLEKAVQKWARMMETEGWRLPEYEMAKAKSYLDWIGPALIRHPQAEPLRIRTNLPEPIPAFAAGAASEWRVAAVPGESFAQAAAAADLSYADERLLAIAELKPVPGGSGSAEARERLNERFAWTYKYAQAPTLFSKTSVSELKRLADHFLADGEDPPANGMLARAPSFHLFGKRPKFMGAVEMTTAERGTIYHAVMQHLPLNGEVTAETVRRTLDRMVERELILPEQRSAVDSSIVLRFFADELGQRLLRADRVYREVPFSYATSAGDIYPGTDESVRDEIVLVQGVMDCIFVENDELVLLDYKTDAIYGDRLEQLAKRYGTQLLLYAAAVEKIWKRPVKEKALFFFDGPHIVRV